MLDKETTAIKDKVLRLYPKLNSLYKGVETTIRREGFSISWGKGELWFRKESQGTHAFHDWQGPEEVVLVARWLPELLDALDLVKSERVVEEQRRTNNLLAAQSALTVAAERLRMPGTPQHPTEFEDDHNAL